MKMSVYECFYVESDIQYTDKQIEKQLIKLGCVKNNKQKGTFLSDRFINRLGNIVRVGFWAPETKRDKNNNIRYSILSWNKVPIPLVVLRWVKNNFPKNSRIYYEIEGTKLFKGKIEGLYRKYGLSEKLFKQWEMNIQMREGAHRIGKEK